jgi:hypothetical protein
VQSLEMVGKSIVETEREYITTHDGVNTRGTFAMAMVPKMSLVKIGSHVTLGPDDDRDSQTDIRVESTLHKATSKPTSITSGT